MTRASAKDYERKILLATFQDLGISVPTKNVHDHEAPDFLVCMSGRTIGIELREYSQSVSSPRGFPIRQVEGTWEIFREQARATSRVRPEICGVDVFLAFSPIELPPRTDWYAFLEELVRFIDAQRSELGLRLKICTIPASGFPLMQRYLSSVHLKILGDLADWCWNGNAGYVGLTENELRTIFSDKTAKQYEQVDQLWLLVHGGGTIGSMLPFIDNADELAEMTNANLVLENGPFDRVLLWSPFEPSPIYEWTQDTGWCLVREAGAA